MKKVLVIGGTRYFGVTLVKSLLKKGYDVTILTRGLVKDEFGENIKRLNIDRNDIKELERTLKNKEFDIIYDNIAYCADDVLDIFKAVGNVKKYILTSSGSVYEKCNFVKEEDFNPYKYEIKHGNRNDFDYSTGKRLAEAAVFQNFNGKGIAVRFPIVLGVNDYTKRLKFYVDAIFAEKAININNLDSEFCFINEKSAGEFLAFLAESSLEGPINACDRSVIKIGEIVHYIEQKTGKKAIITSDGMAAPYNGGMFTMNAAKAYSLGYEFLDLNKYIYKLIDFYCDNIGNLE